MQLFIQLTVRIYCLPSTLLDTENDSEQKYLPLWSYVLSRRDRKETNELKYIADVKHRLTVLNRKVSLPSVA